MEPECIFCLLLLTISSVYSSGVVGRGNVIELYKKVPAKGVEHDSKCDVQGTWKHMDESYDMVCYQCNDDKRYVIISYLDSPLQHMEVLSCNHVPVAGSVTIVPVKYAYHKIEYDLNTGLCSYIIYYSDHTSKILKCEDWLYRYDPPTRLKYHNGWKHINER